MRGDGSPEQLAMLGSQRQRAEAYAAAAARATPGGGDRPTPVALGSSIPEGLEARAAAAMSLDELVKLPTYSMARIASETDDFVHRAPFPITNVSPAFFAAGGFATGRACLTVLAPNAHLPLRPAIMCQTAVCHGISLLWRVRELM